MHDHGTLRPCSTSASPRGRCSSRRPARPRPHRLLRPPHGSSLCPRSDPPRNLQARRGPRRVGRKRRFKWSFGATSGASGPATTRSSRRTLSPGVESRLSSRSKNPGLYRRQRSSMRNEPPKRLRRAFVRPSWGCASRATTAVEPSSSRIRSFWHPTLRLELLRRHVYARRTRSSVATRSATSKRSDRTSTRVSTAPLRPGVASMYISG